MKIIPIIAFLFVCLTSTAVYAQTAVAPELKAEEIVVEPIAKPLTLREKIDAYATEKGVPLAKVHYIFEHESRFNPKATGDMNITCKRTGKPVRSRGLSMITECYHPEVTDAQAYNEDFALKWGIDHMVSTATCKQEFSTCRDYYNK